MRRQGTGICWGLWLCVMPLAHAYEPDVFATQNEVSGQAVKDLGGNSLPCLFDELPETLSLEEVIERVLCNDPKTRMAWASAKVQAAEVGVGKSAYLPRLDGSAGHSVKRTRQDYDDAYYPSSNAGSKQDSASLSLSWVLLDFGRRGAALRSARQLLVAANANQDAALQDAFVVAADAFYDALAAQRSLAASVQVAQMAEQNLQAADAKFKAGAAALSDRLQAQTAFSKASLEQVRKAGALEDAIGVVALRMGLPPDTRLTLVGDLSVRPDTRFVRAIDELLTQAKEDHPSLIAAKARVKAAQAQVDQSRAQGRPTVSLVAGLDESRLDQPLFPNGGDVRVRDKSIGLELKIPLFEGFERTYRTRGALAQVESGEAQLADAQQQVALSVWSSYQALSVETQSLQRTNELLDQSRQTLEVVQGRYHSGVGSMLELLTALSAYSQAEDLEIQSLTQWQSSRLKLAASLGRLGFWALKAD